MKKQWYDIRTTIAVLALLLSCYSAPFLAGFGQASPLPVPASIITGDGDSLIADIAEKRVAGVVNISSTKLIKPADPPFINPLFNDPFFREFFGNSHRTVPRERRERSLGSGVIVSAEGLVITNSHVVENAEEIVVTLADRREFMAELVGTDPRSDVAVIRLKEAPDDLEAIPIGNSGDLRLGDIVLAIGNPFGLDHTVTMGIVSAKGRANVGITDYEDFIQTDAAINPGNSGGALLSLKGELVGVNTAILSRSGGYQGIGFAIPSNMVKAVMESLVRYGKVERGWLGASFQDLDKDLAEVMGLKGTSGVLVSDLAENGPAGKAGIKRGDVVLRVDGDKMASASRLRNMIAVMGAGTKVRLDILRDGREISVSLSLGELPEEFDGQATLGDTEGILGGLTVAPLNELTRQKFEIEKTVKTGVTISRVEPGSSAEKVGLEPGDVIFQINRQDVNSIKSFKKIYDSATGNMLLLVYRKGRTYYAVLKK